LIATFKDAGGIDRTGKKWYARGTKKEVRYFEH
jgi:hypothetical protein